MKCKICSKCGASLDFGERCDCQIENKAQKKSLCDNAQKGSQIKNHLYCSIS